MCADYTFHIRFLSEYITYTPKTKRGESTKHGHISIYTLVSARWQEAVVGLVNVLRGDTVTDLLGMIYRPNMLVLKAQMVALSHKFLITRYKKEAIYTSEQPSALGVYFNLDPRQFVEKLTYEYGV